MFRNYFIIQDPPNLILLLTGEVGVIDVVGDLDLGHIILSGRDCEVALVDPLMGQPFSLKRPVTSSRPVSRAFSRPHRH